MSKQKFKHLWIELYHTDIYWVTCSRQKYEKLIRHEFDQEAPPCERDCGSRFEVYEKTDREIGVIWLREEKTKEEISKYTIGILGHEALHAVHWILQKRGIWLTDSSEEVYAYLIQFIVDKLFNG
jgi:hypothetical protein